MSIERRGVTSLRTMAGLVDARRARTSQGALLELSMLEVEKTRLSSEMARAERRCADIRKRIAQINTKAQGLHRFVQQPASGAAPEAAAPFPIYTAPRDKVKSRRLSY